LPKIIYDGGSLGNPAIAFRNGGFGLFEATCGFRRLWHPVFPASHVFLEKKPCPAIVFIRQEHLPVELIQIGSRFGGRQSGLGHGKQLAAERFPLLDERGGIVAFALMKKIFCLSIHGNQVFHRLTVPAFGGGIALHRRHGRRRRRAGAEYGANH